MDAITHDHPLSGANLTRLIHAAGSTMTGQRLSLPSTSQPRINLIDNIMARVRRPSSASVAHSLRQHPLLDRIDLLHHIHVQASADVPRNVAMERPYAWIVGVVLNDNVAWPGRVAGPQ